MKKLTFIFSILLIASCGESEINTTTVSKVTTKDNTFTKDVKPFSNPAIIYGTDFGNFFKTLYNHGRFEDMLSFTSSQSINQFGKDVILNFYKNDLKFGYELGYRPISQNIDGNVITLNYNANIIATKRVIRISVIIENDSCKILLPSNLKNFPK